MSETPLSEIDPEQVLTLTVHDNAGDDYLVDEATLIGCEQNGDELVIWTDTEME